MKQRARSFLLALILTLALAPAAWAAEAFTDVSSTHWAYDDIMACAEQGIVNGMGDGKFDPNGTVTYAQFVVMVTKAFFGDDVRSVTDTAGKPWYYPYMKVLRDYDMDVHSKIRNEGGWPEVVVANNPVNRYEMATIIRKTLMQLGLNPETSEEFAYVNDSIRDYDQIPMPKFAGENIYYIDVPICYYYGILSGMEDGCFHGEQTMTRAQACVVLQRMTRLPGIEVSAQPITPAQPQQTAGKLLNGEDATVENVVATLKEIEEKYPTGTPWGPSGTANNNWYIAPATSKTRDVVTCTNKVAPSTSLIYACGGWAAMVSETIFGQSGAPCREVYSMKDARPGDILYKVYTGTTRGYHVAIITSVVKNPDDGTYRITTCGGNVNGKVAWDWNNEYGDGAYGMQTKDGSISYRIFTRYPD